MGVWGTGIAKRGGVFKLDDDVASPMPNEVGGLRYTYDEPESPNEGACSRYMLNLNRRRSPMRGRVLNRNRQMRGRV